MAILKAQCDGRISPTAAEPHHHRSRDLAATARPPGHDISTSMAALAAAQLLKPWAEVLGPFHGPRAGGPSR
ncbi:hypothetical protein ACFX1R_026960 [Malus domestica]